MRKIITLVAMALSLNAFGAWQATVRCGNGTLTFDKDTSDKAGMTYQVVVRNEAVNEYLASSDLLSDEITRNYPEELIIPVKYTGSYSFTGTYEYIYDNMDENPSDYTQAKFTQLNQNEWSLVITQQPTYADEQTHNETKREYVFRNCHSVL